MRAGRTPEDRGLSVAAYYNEHNSYAAQWLRNLISAGHIAPGEVDDRSIVDVQPADLVGFSQCHFFAGIGGWSLGLHIAGWPDDRPVWTGSCPCQPFSAAGKRGGFDDARHLWPEFFRLINACRPDVVFGEQVASSDVVGRVSKVRRGKAGDGVPDTQSRRLEALLQGLRERGSQVDQAMAFAAQESLSGLAARDASRLRADRRCKASGEGEVDPVWFGLARYPGEDRHGLVRGDGATVRSDGAKSVERPLSGSEETGCGLHDRQHAGRDLCTEHDGERLGRGRDLDGRGRDSGATLGEEVERLLSTSRGGPDAPDDAPWLDLVRADLERAGYTVGACVLPACGVGSPHIRQRLWWVADTDGWQSREARPVQSSRQHGQQPEDGVACVLADTGRQRLPAREREAVLGTGRWSEGRAVEQCGGASAGGMGHAECLGAGRDAGSCACPEGRAELRPAGHDAGPSGAVGGVGDASRDEQQADRPGSVRGEKTASTPGIGSGYGIAGAGGDLRPGPTNGFWRNPDWLFCRDGKWRPVEASPQPMADGLPNSLGRVRPEIICSFEKEVNDYASSREISSGEALRNLWNGLAPQAQCGWTIGGLPGLHSPPFLLAFLCQLATEGWRITEGIPLSRSQNEGASMRMLWHHEAVARSPCERGLDGQHDRECADAVHFLSPILARYTQAAWGDAYQAHAEVGFPIGHGSLSRVGRLRAYGNAIVPQAAAEVISAFMECRP